MIIVVWSNNPTYTHALFFTRWLALINFAIRAGYAIPPFPNNPPPEIDHVVVDRISICTHLLFIHYTGVKSANQPANNNNHIEIEWVFIKNVYDEIIDRKNYNGQNGKWINVQYNTNKTSSSSTQTPNQNGIKSKAAAEAKTAKDREECRCGFEIMGREMPDN